MGSPPGPPPEVPQGPQTAVIEGQVTKYETGEKLVGAVITLLTAPNAQRGPIRTDEEGCFRFADLPEDSLTLIASGRAFGENNCKFKRWQMKQLPFRVELKPEGEPVGRFGLKAWKCKLRMKRFL